MLCKSCGNPYQFSQVGDEWICRGCVQMLSMVCSQAGGGDMNDEKFAEALAEAYRLDQPRPVEWVKFSWSEDPVPVVVMRRFVDELRRESTYDAQNSASVATGINGVDK